MSRSPEESLARKVAVRWGRFVLRFRVPLLITSVALTVLSVRHMVLHLKADTTDDRFLEYDSEAARVTDRFRDDFGQDVFFQLLVEGDVFSPEYLDRLAKLQEACESLDLELPSLGVRTRISATPAPEVEPAQSLDGQAFDDWGEDEGWGAEGGSLFEEVTSILDARITRADDGGGIRVGGFIESAEDGRSLRSLRDEALATPSLVGNVLAPDAAHSVVLLRTDFMDTNDIAVVDGALRAIAREHTADGFGVRVAGMPAIQASVLGRIQQDSGRLLILSIVIMSGVLGAVFRRLPWVLIPMFSVLQAVFWTLGSMAWAGVHFSALTSILPAFLMVVGLGDGIHVQAVQRALVRDGMPWRDALVESLGHAGTPILFTTVTTALGLSSFAFTTSQLVQEMGMFGALGTWFALWHALTTLPALLSFFPPKRVSSAASAGAISWFLDATMRFGLADESRSLRRRRAWAIIAGAALICGVAIIGIGRLRVSHDILSWMPEDAPARVAVEAVDRHVGGTADLALLVQPRAGKTFKDLEVLNALERLESHVLSYRDPTGKRRVVATSASVLDAIRETNRALNDGAADAYEVPQEPGATGDLLALFSMSGPEYAQRLLTVDESTALMTFRVRWMDGHEYGPLISHVMEGVDRLVDDQLAVVPTGTVHNGYTVIQSIVGNLLRSFGVALLTISVVMTVLLGGLRLGLLAMVPNLLPVLCILGGMGLIGIPLDMANIVVASIAIGISVDDTIHYFHHFREALAETGDTEKAIQLATQRAGSAIVVTSLVLAIGFSVYFTATLSNMRLFGVLVWTATVAALAFDLVLAPALLRAFHLRERTAAAGDSVGFPATGEMEELGE